MNPTLLIASLLVNIVLGGHMSHVIRRYGRRNYGIMTSYGDIGYGRSGHSYGHVSSYGGQSASYSQSPNQPEAYASNLAPVESSYQNVHSASPSYSSPSYIKQQSTYPSPSQSYGGQTQSYGSYSQKRAYSDHSSPVSSYESSSYQAASSSY